MFFSGHKRKDVVEYRNPFLVEIKAYLLYFVKFSKDASILPKKYPNNCIVRRADRSSIIMITYNKIIFSAND